MLVACNVYLWRTSVKVVQWPKPRLSQRVMLYCLNVGRGTEKNQLSHAHFVVDYFVNAVPNQIAVSSLSHISSSCQIHFNLSMTVICLLITSTVAFFFGRSVKTISAFTVLLKKAACLFIIQITGHKSGICVLSLTWHYQTHQIVETPASLCEKIAPSKYKWPLLSD